MAIELIVSDVDGTLTDGSVWFGDDYNGRYRQFSTLDGEGISIWKIRGKEFIMISSSADFSIQHRADWLNVDFYGGVDDKLLVVRELASELDLDMGQVCFIGNDVPDISVLEECGYPACPRDAHPEVIHAIQNRGAVMATKYFTVGRMDGPYFISTERGGHGAVRSLIDWLLINDCVPIHYRPSI